MRHEQYRKQTKGNAFLATMERIAPWMAMCEVIKPHDPNAGNGRPPEDLERMLQMYCNQHWLNLADAGCEDALPDEHKLGQALFAELAEVLQAQGMKVGTGTIVDATIISAPNSTKSAEKNSTQR